MIIIVNEFGKRFNKENGRELSKKEKIDILTILSCAFRDIFYGTYKYARDYDSG